MNFLDTETARRLHYDLLREILKVQNAHEALLRTIVEARPPIEAAALLDKYEKQKAKTWEETLLELEQTQPAFAAMLDLGRDEPPQPPPQKP